MLSLRNSFIICYNLANKLIEIGINDINDLETIKIYQIRKELYYQSGVVGLAMNYLFMLTGDNTRVKIDIHIYRFVENAIGVNLNDEEIQELFTKAVEILNSLYPDLTITLLDNTIWQKYSAQ